MGKGRKGWSSPRSRPRTPLGNIVFFFFFAQEHGFSERQAVAEGHPRGAAEAQSPRRLAAVDCWFRFGISLGMKIVISSHSSIISGMDVNSKIEERYCI